jgi:class 3 adenylate cyclase/tetratricopeptide (TPR) repeat protein
MTNDLAKWLEAHGLGQCASVLTENEVDLEALGLLSEYDLQQLGIPLGPRKKLLRAITESTAAGTSALTAPAEPISGTAAIGASRDAEGERRQLTVLFCDMVGFTELAARVDPEVLQRIIRSYEDACAVCITRYEGYVFQRLGDGIVAFFGYPLAHESESERAIHSGLEIIEALSKLVVPEAGHVAVRIGIATGLVVVSGIEKGAVGETMNLASRLQGIAPSGNIVVSERVHRLAGGSFEYEDLGEQALKGIAQPTRAYRVLGVSEAASRFDAAAGQSLTPLVGREQELALLTERWVLSREGEGQVVLLSGEPGIGKSRILNALREQLEGHGARALRFQCSPYYINSAFWPSIDNLERALKFGREESQESRLDKLEALIVGHYGRPRSDVRFIAYMLSIPCDSRYGELAMSAQKRKDESIRALVDMTEAAARKQPSVLLFEDMHWADPSTLEVMDLLIDRVRDIPLLMVLTHRPEFRSRWNTHGHVSALNLSKLTRAQSIALISRLTGGRSLPDEVLEQILSKTDGVPLFVEELTKSVLESGDLKKTRSHFQYAGTVQSISIPATLRDSLMARLDRFMPVKEVAQMGAAIGREFSYELISAVSPMHQVQLDRALTQLTDSGLAFRRGTPPDCVYTFKHALIQDAAYDSLLKSRRQEMHAKIARIIEERFPEIKSNEPEILAQHYTGAGMIEHALPFWSTAGKNALERTALVESVGHFSRALQLVHLLPVSLGRDQNELDIRINLAIAQMAYGGWTYAPIPQTLAPATDIAKRLGDTQKEMLALFYICLFHVCTPNTKQAIKYANRLQSLAESSSDRTVALVAGAVLTEAMCAAGEYLEAKRHGDKVLALYEFDRDANLTFSLNHDVRGMVLSWAANYYWALGYPQKAREASIAYLESAPRIGHAFNQLFALTVGTEGLIQAGDTKRALQCNREARALVRQNAMSFGEQGPCNYYGGPALIADGQYLEGYEMASRGIEFWNSVGGRLKDPFVNNLRAVALGMLGRVDEGVTLARETICFTNETDHRTWEAISHRVLGDLLVKSHCEGDAMLEEAETAYTEALRISRAKSAKGLELIAATGLCRLWKLQGKVSEARDLLAPIYSWFTEGFDTKDLREANALLNELQ